MPRLDVYQNSDLKFQVQVKDEPFWIGRGSDCLVSLTDPLVSHRHAHLAPSAEGWEIRNEGRNGTRLNDKPLGGTARLNFGDRIYIGPYAIVFVSSFSEPLRGDPGGPTETPGRTGGR